MSPNTINVQAFGRQFILSASISIVCICIVFSNLQLVLGDHGDLVVSKRSPSSTSEQTKNTAKDNSNSRSKVDEQTLINNYRLILSGLKDFDPHNSLELTNEASERQSGGQQYYKDKAVPPHEMQQQPLKPNVADHLTESTSSSINNESLLKQTSSLASPIMFMKTPEPFQQSEREQQNKIELATSLLENELLRRLRLDKYLKSTSGSHNLLAPLLYAQQRRQADSAINYDGPMVSITDTDAIGTWSNDGDDAVVAVPTLVSVAGTDQYSDDSRDSAHRLLDGLDKKNEFNGARALDTLLRKRASLMSAFKRGHHASTSNHKDRKQDDSRVDHNQGVGLVQPWTGYPVKSHPLELEQSNSQQITTKINSNNNGGSEVKEAKYFNPEQQDGKENSNELTTIPQSIKSMYESQSDNNNVHREDQNDNSGQSPQDNTKGGSDYIQRVINDKWNILKHLNNYNNNNNKIENLRFQDEMFKRSSLSKDESTKYAEVQKFTNDRQPASSYAAIARTLYM